MNDDQKNESSSDINASVPDSDRAKETTDTQATATKAARQPDAKAGTPDPETTTGQPDAEHPPVIEPVEELVTEAVPLEPTTEPTSDSGDEAEKQPEKPKRRRSSVKSAKPAAPEQDNDETEPKPARSRAKSPKHKRRMLISYIPGEECRVAIVEGDDLEEYYAERTASANRVGNIYLGRVTNVEPAIQAAFVDFGAEENAFLHVTDLHPRYFPSENAETVERIGKKTARSARPPIQACLKRGQQIVVQVLKDGVGTKGPAVTSYLSIPGRYLVMMPNMDKVGVSRKVEDEDMRKKMKKQLDQLDLPEGFGFILRTAGLDKNKTELKRDLAYLQRLWKDMEKRQKKVTRPTLLYAESDLLVRSLRDILTTEIDEIVVDDLAGVKRAANFLKIVSPRTSRNLLHYPDTAPIFHAFRIEDQLKMLHNRTVPLPSGGALVIDETEALVAIDVNSGKSRAARDAETNAFETNKEAAEAICRQLKLRELGGLVICDLIDMMQAKHRKEIEKILKERLANDKNRATILPISEFGILQMTRQRSQASHSSIHYTTAPDIKGRAMFRKPESLTSEALREMAAVASRDKVERVELVVPPRVAGEMLTNRRRSISRLERRTGKSIDVRVSDQLQHDRYVIYAYDENGNDVDVDRLPAIKPPKKLIPWSEIAEELGESYDWADEPEEAHLDPDAEADKQLEKELDEASHPIEQGDTTEESDGEGGTKKKRRRRRRRRGGRSEDGENQNATEDSNADTQGTQPTAESSKDASSETGRSETVRDEDDNADSEGGTKKKRRRRRRRGGRSDDGENQNAENTDDQPQADAGSRDESSDDEGPDASESEGGTKKKRRRRRRRSGESENGDSSSRTSNPPEKAAATSEPKPEKKKRRTLYGGGRRKLTASEKAALGDD